jgi:hypothetical protein
MIGARSAENLSDLSILGRAEARLRKAYVATSHTMFTEIVLGPAKDAATAAAFPSD